MATVILVDDFDIDRVLYGSGWTTGRNVEREYNGTVHSISTKGGSFDFAFNGTKVGVYGTIDQNTSSAPIECLIDGQAVSVSQVTAPANETWYQSLFCEGVVPDDSEHKLTVTLTADVTNTHPFLLDYILYEVPLDPKNDAIPGQNAGIVIAVDDRATEKVSFDNLWWTSGVEPEFQGTTHGTTSIGARALFKFNGTKAAAYGTVDTDADSNSQWTTTYQIDDGPVTTLHSSEWSAPPPLHQIKFFESDNLDDTDHTLLITYTSGPLKYWLDFFTYTPLSSFGFVPLALEPGSSSSLSTSEPSTSLISTPITTNVLVSDSSSFSLSLAGAIAGIAVGGVAISALIVITGIVVFKKRKRTKLAQPVAFGPSHTSQNRTSRLYGQLTRSPGSMTSAFCPNPRLVSNCYDPNAPPDAANYEGHTASCGPANTSFDMIGGDQVSSGNCTRSGQYQDDGIGLVGGSVRCEEGAGEAAELPPPYSEW